MTQIKKPQPISTENLALLGVQNRKHKQIENNTKNRQF